MKSSIKNLFGENFRLLKRILVVLMLGCSVSSALAQISITGGVNYCDVRNHNLLQNEKGILTGQMGVEFRLLPFRNLPSVFMHSGFILFQKGYEQNLDKRYLFHFNYISVPVTIGYAISKDIAVDGGFDLNGLLSASVEQGTKTYNNFDAGLTLGISFFDSQRLSLFTRFNYGLVPMLNYYSIDKLGNFTGTIKDLRNISVSVGIKIKVYNEEIHLYK